LPEREFSVKQFISDITEVYDKYGRCTVAVSEGISDASGQPILTTLGKDLDKDAHGNVTLSGTGALGDLLTQCVKDNLKGLRVRSDTFGFLQRSFLGCVSDVDSFEAREVGEKAVQFALGMGYKEGSVTMERVGCYAVDYKLTPIAEVAGRTKVMPAEFINEAGNHITEAFKAYARPLIGSALPTTSRLNAPMVPKL
jgi:6-phosphofructokinase 1